MTAGQLHWAVLAVSAQSGAQGAGPEDELEVRAEPALAALLRQRSDLALVLLQCCLRYAPGIPTGRLAALLPSLLRLLRASGGQAGAAAEVGALGGSCGGGPQVHVAERDEDARTWLGLLILAQARRMEGEIRQGALDVQQQQRRRRRGGGEDSGQHAGAVAGRVAATLRGPLLLLRVATHLGVWLDAAWWARMNAATESLEAASLTPAAPSSSAPVHQGRGGSLSEETQEGCSPSSSSTHAGSDDVGGGGGHGGPYLELWRQLLEHAERGQQPPDRVWLARARVKPREP